MNKFDPNIHHRRSIRLKGYDYTRAGAYYVTICVERMECLLGEVVQDEMYLSEWGRIVVDVWLAIPEHFRHVELDEFVVMPNHMHGIFVFAHDAYDMSRGAAMDDFEMEQHTMPRGTKARSMNAVVQNFKSVTTRKINTQRDTAGTRFWQRDCYEHIVRNEYDLERIRTYIANNPANWENDDFYPRG